MEPHWVFHSSLQRAVLVPSLLQPTTPVTHTLPGQVDGGRKSWTLIIGSGRSLVLFCCRVWRCSDVVFATSSKRSLRKSSKQPHFLLLWGFTVSEIQQGSSGAHSFHFLTSRLLWSSIFSLLTRFFFFAGCFKKILIHREKNKKTIDKINVKLIEHMFGALKVIIPNQLGHQ